MTVCMVISLLKITYIWCTYNLIFVTGGAQICDLAGTEFPAPPGGLCYNSLYRPTIGYFQHFATSITNAYSTHFVKSSGLNAKAKFAPLRLADFESSAVRLRTHKSATTYVHHIYE